jgi:DNA-binding NarL/FixJ family response regulator
MPLSRNTVLILAPAGPLLDGLAALCAALPHVQATSEFADWDGALHRLRAAPPDLVLLDAAFVHPALDRALEQLRAAAPASARLVIVDEVHQLAPACAGYARLLTGASAAELLAALHRLLSQPQG